MSERNRGRSTPSYASTIRKVLARCPDITRPELLRAIEECSDGGATTLAGLTALLDGSLAWPAAFVLGHIRDRRTVPSLLRIVSNKDYPIETRREAALAVGLAGGNTALRLLLQSLESSTDDSTRELASYALVFMNDKRAIAALLAVVRDVTAEAAVRAQAFEALGALEAIEAYDDAIASLQDHSPQVRFWAASMIDEPSQRFDDLQGRIVPPSQTFGQWERKHLMQSTESSQIRKLMAQTVPVPKLQ
jgi:hypothetical protein